jgi:hypothetical protein
MSFPQEIEIELGNRSVQALRARLAESLGADYVVTVTKELQDLASVDVFSDEVGYDVQARAPRNAAQGNKDLGASIMIRKDVQ